MDGLYPNGEHLQPTRFEGHLRQIRGISEAQIESTGQVGSRGSDLSRGREMG